MKYLIIGASGMLGHIVTLYLNEQGHSVIALTRKPFDYCENVICDVFDSGKLTDVIEKSDYDIVVNCVGLLNQFADKEKDMAVYLNAYLPHLLSRLLRDKGKKLIQISTDCVFSGISGSYKEYDSPDGKTFYDRTKALGELDNHMDLTLRQSLIGPDMDENGIGLLNWFFKQKGMIEGYRSVVWTGATTLELAKALGNSAFLRQSGICHFVNNQFISKYELLNLVKRVFNLPEPLILPVSLPRSQKTLLCTKNLAGYKIPFYEQMLTELLDWMKQHRQLYKHYQSLNNETAVEQE